MRQCCFWTGVQRWRRGTVCGEQRGRRSVQEAEAPLEAVALWVWGYETWGTELEVQGRCSWSRVEQEVSGRWVAVEIPL